ncbi:MAG: sulfite exporter TauE/SafE family protein [Acidimicrobiia bacterium]|nr:sulfite exporter TauE/SafE family protein [Acidimicrobiia bacterium]
MFTLTILEVATAVGLVVLAMLIGVYGTIIGAGGGFLLVPALAVLFGLPGAEAVGTGALTLALIRVSGAVGYHRQGLVQWPAAAWFALGAAAPALLSGWLLTERIDSRSLPTVVGVVLLALAVAVVVRYALAGLPGDEAGREVAPLAPRKLPLLLGASGVGLLNGTFAVGGGLVAMPYLAAVQRLRAQQAAATATAAGVVGSTAATVGHTLNGNVQWAFAPLLFVGALGGSWIGAHWSGRLTERIVMVLLATGLVMAGLPLVVWA